MKKTAKNLLLLAILSICFLTLCSCRLFDSYISTKIVVEIDTDGEYLTTDMSEDDLRDCLKVYRRLTVFLIGKFDREISGYSLECDFNEGYSQITVEYDDMRASTTGLFVRKDKLSREGDFLFCEIKGERYLLEYKGNDKNVVLPEGNPYIIFEKVFYGNNDIESVTLGNSVTQIGEFAFAYSSIKRLDVGTGLASIGKQAFTACDRLEYLNVSSVEQWCLMNFESVIPLHVESDEDVIAIQDQQYVVSEDYYRYHIGSLDMYRHAYGASTVSVDRTFVNFYNEKGNLVHQEPIPVSSPVYFTRSIHVGGEKLVDLVIPESVNELSIGFAGSDIKSVRIHGNVSAMGVGAFKECQQLETVVVEDFNRKLLDRYTYAFDKDSVVYNELDGVLYIGNEENPNLILVGVADKEMSKLTVPEGTKAIASYALRSNGENICNILLSDSVEFVGEHIIRTKHTTFTFVGGESLRFIGEQEWYFNRPGNIATDIDIGDLENWRRPTNGGFTGVSSYQGEFGIVGIGYPIYRMDLWEELPWEDLTEN